MSDYKPMHQIIPFDLEHSTQRALDFVKRNYMSVAILSDIEQITVLREKSLEAYRKNDLRGAAEIMRKIDVIEEALEKSYIYDAEITAEA